MMRLCMVVIPVSILVTQLNAYEDVHHPKPNIIIFNADDMGWGDLSSYGHPTQEWGPIDDLARDGIRFTNMYAAASLCTPSRAGLLTGRMPIRIGTYGIGGVFWPMSSNGLPREEITLAEALKDVGYVTGMVGKWHLGVNGLNHTDGIHLPFNHGFDYVGHNIPLSNAWECDEDQLHVPSPDPLSCVLYNNATIVQQPFSHDDLTETFVANAIGFLRAAESRRDSFFLYFGLAQQHVNLFSNTGFVGSSKRGRYGDGMREMAWAVGAVMEEVKRLQLDFNTIVLFISDNGPHVQLCNEGGDAGILKGGKMNYWEGGIRVPGIVRWPGHIKSGTVSNEMVSQLDIFPTLLSLTGGHIPDDRPIDGQDISDILFKWQSETEPQPLNRKTTLQEISQNEKNRLLVFFCGEMLFAVRYGSYKFHFYTQKVRSKEENGAQPHCIDGGFPLVNDVYCGSCLDENCTTAYDPPLMFNVDKDPNEAYPLDMSLAQNKVVLTEMIVNLEEFKSGFMKTPSPSLFDSRSLDVMPCCTPETFPMCTCNYPAV